MTITQLLSSRCQFSIPRFQREYSWERRNYQEFFDDMLECLKIDANGKICDRPYLLYSGYNKRDKGGSEFRRETGICHLWHGGSGKNFIRWRGIPLIKM